MSLVPLDGPEKVTILRFWQRQELVKAYTLGDLGYRQRDLQATASHYRWGGYIGLDDDGFFRLEMIDRTVLVFDPTTGNLVRQEKRNAD